MELQICGMFFVDLFLYQDYIVTVYQLYAKLNFFFGYQQKYWENPHSEQHQIKPKASIPRVLPIYLGPKYTFIETMGT